MSVNCLLSCGPRKNARHLIHSFSLTCERGIKVSSQGRVFGADLRLPPGLQCSSRLWVQVEVNEPGGMINGNGGSSAGQGGPEGAAFIDEGSVPMQRSTSEVRPVSSGWWTPLVNGPSLNSGGLRSHPAALQAESPAPLDTSALEWIALMCNWQGIALWAFHIQVGSCMIGSNQTFLGLDLYPLLF